MISSKARRTSRFKFDPRAASFPLVVVLGPTASGKSLLSLKIAEHFGGEILNFDSVQVYRHFNVGTAKLSPAQRRGIPHHLIDVVEPEKVFTAGDYTRLARETLAEIRQRGQLPVMTGGTGFYLRALLEGLFQGPQRDEALRGRLASRAAHRPPGYLHRLLCRLDPVSAGRIHAHDTPKIIRAIEVCLLGGAPMAHLWEKPREQLRGYDVIRLGLDPLRAALFHRIDLRTEDIFAGGLLDEVPRLLHQGVPRQARPFGSLGYRQALQQLDGDFTPRQAIEATAKLTRRYAKRQMTWFRREPDVNWFQGFGDSPSVCQEILDWLERRLRLYQADDP